MRDIYTSKLVHWEIILNLQLLTRNCLEAKVSRLFIHLNDCQAFFGLQFLLGLRTVPSMRPSRRCTFIMPFVDSQLFVSFFVLFLARPSFLQVLLISSQNRKLI